MTQESLWALALIAVVGTAAFYAGWRSAAAYLPAARAVAEISGAAVAQANGFVASLDRTEAALSSLAGEVKANTETLDQRHRAVEDSLLALFQGLERAGLARSPAGRTPGRQVGEKDPGD